MADPRLNSVHLEFPRREQFRHARDVLLNARGNQTVLAEQKGIAEEADHPNTVGRSPDNDVIIQDGFVSRRHCAILVHASKGAELYDTASKNGTFLNGQKIAAPTRLRSGDEIRMCDRNLIFVMREDDVPPSPAHTVTVQE